MSRRKQSKQEQDSSNKWLPTIIVALISTVGLIAVAMINSSTTLKSITFTQTAEVLRASINTSTQAVLNLPTSTPTTPNLTDTTTNTPTKTLPLNLRKIEPKDLSTNILSIWIENDLWVDSMFSPGRKIYAGFVRAGQEYRFSVYWCATNTKTLNQNIVNIKTSFYVNEELLPKDYILTYDYDPEGWKCRYAVVALSGWVINEKYKLEVHQNLLTETFDGKTNYPAGVYIREVNVIAQ